MTSILGARRALVALVAISVLVQAYARPAEWTRDLLDAEEDEFTSPSRGLVQMPTCPSAEKYRRTRRGCLCRRGYGTFVFGYDRSSANPDANMYPTTFPSNCRYYVDGTDTSMNFPTRKGRCFCFTCPSFDGVRYFSAGVGFLNGFSSGCYPYRYFFARIRIQGVNCATLTADTAQYNKIQQIITTAFQARFNQFNNTFSPVVNQFTCTTGANGDAYIGFRLGYLGPFIDAQNGIIADIIANLCQRTNLCTNLNPQLPGGGTTNPGGEASPNPLPPVSTPAPPASPAPPLNRVCAAVPLPTGVQCANLIATNKNCQESNILNPLDAVNLPILGNLGLGTTLSALNAITLQVCVGVLCPALALNSPSYALYAPDTLGLGVGGLRCKCYSNSLLSSGSCTQIPGPYSIYQYDSAGTGGPGTPNPPTGPIGGPILGPITGLLPIGSLTSLLKSGADCQEAPVAIPPASLSLLGLNVISDLQACINACNLVSGRTYASYSSVLGTNLLPTCKCFNSQNCTPADCGLLGLNCLLSSYTIYKYI